MTNCADSFVTADDLDGSLCKKLSDLINASPKSREQIAEGMTALANIPISECMINNWTAKAERGEHSRRSRFPAFLIPIFCQVIGNDELQRWAAGQRLADLAKFAELALKCLEKRKGLK